ncbi:MAG TPA: acyltransferase [Solirubrobacteraceae bacterium]|nr:acyltransferase [Solirubrobacteraceae bacterium]
MNALGAYQTARWLRDRAFSRVAAGAFARCGAATLLELPVRVTGAEGISLGRGVHVGRGSWLYTQAPGRLEIGDGCRLSGNCVLSAVRSVTIGSRVLFGTNVYVADSDHGYEGSEPVMDQPLAKVAPVRIGDGAWLAQNVVVLSGVTIGAGAVIGAGSVVRSDVPARAVAVGAPARIVRRLPG